MKTLFANYQSDDSIMSESHIMTVYKELDTNALICLRQILIDRYDLDPSNDLNLSFQFTGSNRMGVLITLNDSPDHSKKNDDDAQATQVDAQTQPFGEVKEMIIEHIGNARHPMISTPKIDFLKNQDVEWLMAFLETNIYEWHKRNQIRDDKAFTRAEDFLVRFWNAKRSNRTLLDLSEVG